MAKRVEKSDSDNNGKLELQIAKLTTQQAIIVAIVGALASILTVFIKEILVPVTNKDKQEIQKVVNEEFQKDFDVTTDTINGEKVVNGKRK